jgi:hypothetical protein
MCCYFYYYYYYYIYNTYIIAHIDTVCTKTVPCESPSSSHVRTPRPLLLQPLGLGVVEVPQLAQANATVTFRATPVVHGETQGFQPEIRVQPRKKWMVHG